MDKKATPTVSRPSPRERLLAAANELFYEEGINTVGIDRIIEKADVAKASLYDSFGSKEGLIRAYLQARSDARRARMLERVGRHAEPRARLLALFDLVGESVNDPNFRGCAFVRANAESGSRASVRGVCDDARQWARELFTRLSAEAGARDPGALARQLMMLYDGTLVSAQMDHDGAAARAARAAAEALLDGAQMAAPKRKGAKR
jgi:AcrR family transcriptional regulator